MYRLLIVDDEPIIVDGMYELLGNQRDLDLDICRAYSGEEALEWANRSRLDIVLSDIRMPGIDGLKLLGELKRRWPRCRVIFLTVHSEFDYIYHAIQEKGVDYILKTEPHERIFDAIRTCVRELDESLELERFLSASRDLVGLNRILAQKDFIRYLLAAPPDFPVIEQRDLDSAGVPLDAGRGVLLLVARMATESGRASYADRFHVLDEMRLIAEERFSGRVSYAFGETSSYQLLWMLQGLDFGDAGTEEFVLYVRETMELVQDAVIRRNGCRMSCVLSCGECGWDEVASVFQSLEVFFDQEVASPEDGIVLVAPPLPASRTESGWIEGAGSTRANSALARVKKHVDENLAGDVSLVRLAEIAYLNPAYLSRLFKLAEGTTLSEYIEDIRMERAKALLVDGDRKIQEVASLVGFGSSSNFGRFFKRKEGLTPQEYRERR